MPVLCFGPVCVPLNLLLPFLLGIAHRYGWLKWIKREWLTLTWWKDLFLRRGSPAAQQQRGGSSLQTAAICSSNSTASAQGSTGPLQSQYICNRDICQLVSPEDEASIELHQQPYGGKQRQQAEDTAAVLQPEDATATPASDAAGAEAVRRRRTAHLA